MVKKYHENPPTAGLPVLWRDWIPKKQDLATYISSLFNLPPMIVTCSGTIALVVALKTLAKENPHRKSVIIPAYTCPLVALAIEFCGLKIVLCDSAKDSFDFDFNQLALLLDEQILAVMPTHLGGRVANVAEVKRLASPHGIIVIEDAAQALGADVGTIGDIVFFSLAAGKGLTTYEGGLLTANTEALRQKLAETAKQVPRHIGWEIKRIIELAGYTALYNPFGLYFVYGVGLRKALRNNDLIDAVGDHFGFDLPYHRVSRWRQHVAANSAHRLPSFITATTDQALRRIELLKKIDHIDIVMDTCNQKGTWPFIMVLLPSQKIRDNILEQLWPSSLGVSRLFIHDLPNYEYLQTIIPQVSTPNADDLASRMLTITNSLWLQDSEFTQIYEAIQSHLPC